MRIQMRLSQESEFILKKEKENYKKKEDISVTSGWLVNRFIKKISEFNFKNIDWKKVNSTHIPLTDKLKTNDCDYNTTLNLEKTVIITIESLQSYFKEVFKVSRVHKAFVVRLVLKAYYLLENGIKIFKEE